MRFLRELASGFFREDDDEPPAAGMNCCDHDPANFFWKLLQNGLFIAIGCRGFLRLASKLEMQLAFVCQRRVLRDITEELATEALQGVLGIGPFPFCSFTLMPFEREKKLKEAVGDTHSSSISVFISGLRIRECLHL